MSQRSAVVVTHSRLRTGGTVVREAVEQLRQSGFSVSIIDNLEAPEFGMPSPIVDEDTEIVVVLGETAPFCAPRNWSNAPMFRFWASIWAMWAFWPNSKASR